MKAIINRKMYNTETADLIGGDGNGKTPRDFSYLYEELYRKENGEYFLAGEGGGLTKYKEAYGDMWGFGEKIIPLTEEEAMAWGEKHLSVAKYIDTFGEVAE